MPDQRLLFCKAGISRWPSCCRVVSGIAWAAAGSHHIYTVGTDAKACTIDAMTGKVQQKFETGKHALTCVKAAPGNAAVNTWLVGGLMQLRQSSCPALLKHLAFAVSLMSMFNIHGSAVQMGSVCWLAALVWLCGMRPPKSVCTSTLATQ